MGAIFRVGEQKVRPGSFIRYENAGSAQSAGATAGVAAAVFKADWGPLGKVVDIESQGQKDKLYGTANGTTNTSDVIDELLKGVARIKAVRLGAGGTKATLALKDTAATPATVVNATAKYPGTKALSVTIKDSIIEATKREFIVYSGTTELQKIVFDKDSGDVDTLIDAWKAAGSDWVDLTKVATGTGILATISGQSLSGGANPTITNADYTDAFSVLEPIEWNVMAVDSEDNSIHTLLNNYILRVFNDGKMVRAVVGETTFVDFDTRVADAYMLNNFLMHYCINGYTENGVDKEGYKAAARVAGILTAAAANESLTHYAISGASGLTETLTNAEIEYALNSGCLVFTQSTAGPIQIEYGINTLVVLSSDQDAGWKKIRRVSTRIELMKRITATTDPLIGKVDNDPDGRATLMAAAQGVVNDMAGEGKLLPGGTVVLDTQNPPEGDSAWFKVAVDDIDSAEKLYFAFGFKFAPTTA